MNKNNQAIVIIGGGLVKDKGKWRTTNFKEGDKYGVKGDRLRVDAAEYLFRENEENEIIALGGKGQLKDIPDAPTVSEAIKQELKELGVPDDRIIKEEESGNSWQQLQELKKILKEHEFENVVVISNKYHLLRIEAMMEQDVEFKELLSSGKLELQAAEEILIEKEPGKWKDEIDRAYDTEAMRERIALEERGVRDLKEGKYKLR